MQQNVGQDHVFHLGLLALAMSKVFRMYLGLSHLGFLKIDSWDSHER